MDKFLRKGEVFARLFALGEEVKEGGDHVAVALDFPGAEKLHGGDAIIVATVTLGRSGVRVWDDGIIWRHDADLDARGQVDAAHHFDGLGSRVDDFNIATMATDFVLTGGAVDLHL